jgi:tRNA pseudouridine(38-40) synthase
LKHEIHQLILCRNPGFKTIEEELLKAFRDSGVIANEWFDNMQSAFFQRASRTDKGVSAAKMIISLKMRKLDFTSPKHGIMFVAKRILLNNFTACYVVFYSQF